MPVEDRRIGPFRLTSKSTGGPFGGWEAACPFHRKNARTGCKKFVGIKGPTAEHRENALKHLAIWCIAARSFDRQWKHSGYNPANLDGWPPLEVLLEHPSFAELRPATTVATDVELQQGGDRPENSVPAATAPDVPDAALPAATAPDAVASSSGSSSNESSNGSSSNTSKSGSSDSDS
jgi:hypothetical protein